MKKLLAVAAVLLASSAAQAQYTFDYGGKTIRIDPDRGTVQIPGVYDNTKKAKKSKGDEAPAAKSKQPETTTTTTAAPPPAAPVEQQPATAVAPSPAPAPVAAAAPAASPVQAPVPPPLGAQAATTTAAPPPPVQQSVAPPLPAAPGPSRRRWSRRGTRRGRARFGPQTTAPGRRSSRLALHHDHHLPLPRPVPFHEEDLWNGYPEETNAPYGIAKLAQLVHAQTAREQYGQDIAYLIPTNLYGPGDKFHPAVSHVIPALIKKCVDAVEAGADHIELWGTGSASREFLYVNDAAAGIVLAAEHYSGAEPVNLGTDREMPVRELVGHIAEATGFTGEVRWDPSKPDGQPRRRVDASRARKSFGFEATTSFAEGLAATVAWYLAHRDEAESRAD